MSGQKHAEKVLTGAVIDMKDGRQLTIKTVGDYEPWDPSVGIMSGFVGVETEDGGEYEVMDDGSVYASGASEKVGQTLDLLPDCD